MVSCSAGSDAVPVEKRLADILNMLGGSGLTSGLQLSCEGPAWPAERAGGSWVFRGKGL